jgi:hypothetical protein
MERRVEVEKLRPGDINEETRRIVCCLLVNGVEFRSREEPNIAKIMGGVYNANTTQTLREMVRREDFGLYVARWGQAALATTAISLQEGDGAPHYDDPDKPAGLMYMGHLGVVTNDDTWKRHFMGIVKQARSDFGNKKVTGLGAYVDVDDDNELPKAVESLNPRTYKVFGGEAGVYGTVDGAPGHYRLHTVEFTKGIGRAGLAGSIKRLLTNRPGPHDNIRLSSDQYIPAAPKREEVPVAA